MPYMPTNHSDVPIRLFKSDYLEFFTHIHPGVVLLIWLPIALWHLAQMASMARGPDAAPAADRFRTVWAPWQSTQFAACSFPARSARP